MTKGLLAGAVSAGLLTVAPQFYIPAKPSIIRPAELKAASPRELIPAMMTPMGFFAAKKTSGPPTIISTQSTTPTNPNSSTATRSLTVPSGCDCLVLALALTSNSTRTFSGVTFNSVAMTEIVESGASAGVAIYYLLSPSIGTYNAVTTFSASVDRSFSLFAYYLSGVTGVDVFNVSSTITSGAVNTAITPTTDCLVIGSCEGHTVNGAQDSGNFSAGVTKDYQVGFQANGTYRTHSCGSIVRSAGSYTMTYTRGFASITTMALAVAAFK